MTATIHDLTQHRLSKRIKEARSKMHLIRMDTMAAWQSDYHQTVMGPLGESPAQTAMREVRELHRLCELMQLPCDSEPA